MIELVVFHIHIVAALYAFTKRWQRAGIKEGLLAVGLIALVFTIGWAVTSPLANLILPNQWRKPWFNSDTLGLLLLLIVEIYLYRMFFLQPEEPAAPNDVQ